MYGVQLDGTLLWYGYDGFVDGAPTWRAPKEVGRGWNEFTHVFPGGDYVIYGVLPSGSLRWYRHVAGGHGGGKSSDWLGPREVGVGWGGYPTVFSGGDGVIYGIDALGNLHRAIHRGHLDGTAEWDGEFRQIGVGWDGFIRVAATYDGVIYGFKRDGRVFWCRYGLRRQGHGPVLAAGHPFWEGSPVVVKRGLPAIRHAFCGMSIPFVGPH